MAPIGNPVLASGARTSAPRWMTWAPTAVLGWAAAYGLVRVWFALGHAPEWELPADLLVPGWWSVALCAVSAGLAVALRVRPASRPLIVATWAVAAGWVCGCAFLLLDGVAAVLPGLGIPFDPAGMASRAGGLTGAALLAATALAYQRRATGDCVRCSRTRPAPRQAETPGWARRAAWLAISGCLLRLAAQYAVGFDSVPYDAGASLLLFEAGFVLAGIVLPLALVQRWGRVFPRWMLLLPGFGLGTAISAYFGVGMIQVVVETVAGTMSTGDLPAAFLWVAVPAYVGWGAGLLIATYGYYLRTRQPCRACGR